MEIVAVVCALSNDMAPLEIPAVEPRRSRVLDRVDGVELIACDRPLPLDPDDVTDYGDDFSDDEDPYADLRVSERGEILGLVSRRPDWVQGEQIPGCPGCRRPMRPVLQLECLAGGGINFGDVGCGYAFVCPGCRGAAFLLQCH